MIATLLGLALQLIIAAQQPNVPVELRNEALKVAILAINTAESQINSPDTSPVFGVPATPPVIDEVNTVVPKPVNPLSVDLKVNGSDGPLTIKRHSCIINGTPTCERVDIELTSQGNVGKFCSVTSDSALDPYGNMGSSNEYIATISATSTNIVFKCETSGADISDTVLVNLTN